MLFQEPPCPRLLWPLLRMVACAGRMPWMIKSCHCSGQWKSSTRLIAMQGCPTTYPKKHHCLVQSSSTAMKWWTSFCTSLALWSTRLGSHTALSPECTMASLDTIWMSTSGNTWRSSTALMRVFPLALLKHPLFKDTKDTQTAIYVFCFFETVELHINYPIYI